MNTRHIIPGISSDYHIYETKKMTEHLASIPSKFGLNTIEDAFLCQTWEDTWKKISRMENGKNELLQKLKTDIEEEMRGIR